MRAVNLIGYGRTPPWPRDAPQSLADQAVVVAAATPDGAADIRLVGHSLGGAIAMKAATLLGNRVTKVVLLEANPFYLLADAGRDEAYAEARSLRDCIKAAGASGEWEQAARVFADYWGGAGAWDAMSEDRRASFALALRPNYFEWDTVLDETTPLAAWGDLLPAATMFVYDPGTVRPIREIAALLREAHPHWKFQEIAGGHMAPLTRPDLVNAVVAAFLDE